MKINRQALKGNSRLLIARTQPSPLMIGLVYIALDLLLTYLESELLGYGQYTAQIMEQINNIGRAALPIPTNITLPAWLLIFAIVIMRSVLDAGFCSCCLKICQGKKAGFKNLMDGFTVFFKLILLRILTGIITALGFFLFVIPGIIAFYSYRQTVYILLENPELGPMECILRSRAMMSGHKIELFVLDLSFIGWRMLSSLLFFPIFWYQPYSGICYAGYYIALRDMPRSQIDFSV